MGPALALAVVLALWRWSTHEPETGPPAVATDVPPAVEPADARPPPPGAAPRPPPEQPARDGAPDCVPGAVLRCHRGDVWSYSSCGEREERAEECGDSLCQDGHCARALDVVCQEPAEGRCDGQVVVLCIAGRTQRVDCGAQGMSCAQGQEGAECVPAIPPEQRCQGPARCEKNTLVRCEGGRVARTDCGALRAQCLTLPGAREPSCLRVEMPAVQGCGPCGCQEDGSGELECDGQDEDNDRHVDEGIDCGPVPVIAFVITDERGESSYTREDIEAELARVNHLFSSSEEETSLTFELDRLVEIADRRLLFAGDKEITSLVHDSRVHPPHEEFYVPLIFTDQVLAGGGTPKLGVSTLPNGTCGGMQKRAGPEVGMVVVSKTRSPTTVAHEIGHFLGLCHTHDDESPLAGVALAGNQHGSVISCGEVCRAEGDGLCDTPFDPGPELCAYDLTCEALCRGGARPDATNLMSYYTSCRSRFSRDQIRLMQHTLALRRGWHPCIGGRCPCQLGGTECPTGMSCRPVTQQGESAPRCTLDGPRPPASDCEDTSQCGQGALCLHETTRGIKRCTRACQQSSFGCECVSAGSGFGICREDLAG